MKVIFLDDSNFENEYAIHQYLKEQLDFPEYYGNNLDALYDVLTDISEKVTFEFENKSSSMGLKKIIPVIYDAAKENLNITIMSNE